MLLVDTVDGVIDRGERDTDIIDICFNLEICRMYY